MKIAVSNLAWDPAVDPAARDVLITAGIGAIELAPTKIWPDLERATPTQVAAYGAQWSNAGIAVVAFQSLLFGLPNVDVFRPESHPVILNRLQQLARMAGDLGATVMVFGAPKQRRRGELPVAEAFAQARDFFRRAADTVAIGGATLVLEANPVAYGCDFVTTTADAANLVDLVDHPHFGLHLDTACATLSDEDPVGVFPPLAKRARHVHLSARQLAVPGDADAIAFRATVSRMDRNGYDGYFSFEYLGPADHAAQLAALARVGSFIR